MLDQLIQAGPLCHEFLLVASLKNDFNCHGQHTTTLLVRCIDRSSFPTAFQKTLSILSLKTEKADLQHYSHYSPMKAFLVLKVV